MASDAVFDLSRFPPTSVSEPIFAASLSSLGRLDWHAGYVEHNGADGVEGRLVSQHSFALPWETWEMHPQGDEMVLCLPGRMSCTRRTRARFEPSPSTPTKPS